MAEAEAVRRALEAGARHASIRSSELVVDSSETPVWEVVLRVTPRRRIIDQ